MLFAPFSSSPSKIKSTLCFEQRVSPSFCYFFFFNGFSSSRTYHLQRNRNFFFMILRNRWYLRDTELQEHWKVIFFFFHIIKFFIPPILKLKAFRIRNSFTCKDKNQCKFQQKFTFFFLCQDLSQKALYHFQPYTIKRSKLQKAKCFCQWKWCDVYRKHLFSFIILLHLTQHFYIKIIFNNLSSLWYWGWGIISENEINSKIIRIYCMNVSCLIL